MGTVEGSESQALVDEHGGFLGGSVTWWSWLMLPKQEDLQTPADCTPPTNRQMFYYGMVWHGKCEFIQRSCHDVSNALSTLVAREKPGFHALSKGLIVLLCAEIVRQGVPDHQAF